VERDPDSLRGGPDGWRASDGWMDGNLGLLAASLLLSVSSCVGSRPVSFSLLLTDFVPGKLSVTDGRLVISLGSPAEAGLSSSMRGVVRAGDVGAPCYWGKCNTGG
jgi:hypothetical protein